MSFCRRFRPVRRRAETPREGLLSRRACWAVVEENGAAWVVENAGRRKGGGSVDVRDAVDTSVLLSSDLQVQCMVVVLRMLMLRAEVACLPRLSLDEI